MNKAFNPLQAFSAETLKLLMEARGQENPCWYLYQNKARTPLFMVESLLRLVSKIDSKAALKATLKQVKKLEDGLGRVDDYDHLSELFAANKRIKREQVHYFLQKREEELTRFNKNVVRKKFYFKMYQNLSRAGGVNFNRNSFINELCKRITKEVKNCYDFYLLYPKQFTELETQLHEIRRKLRWITIYAQSLGGIIILVAPERNYTWQKRFITPVELKSPYTKVPVKDGLKRYIYFNKKAFFAFSHVVNELGRIKDKALEIEMLKQAIQKTAKVSDQQSEELALKQLKAGKNLEELFKEAHNLVREFFITHKIHELLIIKDQVL